MADLAFDFEGALKVLGWSQADAARELGVHRNTVYGWVRTKKVPGPVRRFMETKVELRRMGS